MTQITTIPKPSVEKPRPQSCKRGHASEFFRLNTQGYWVCRMCHNSASRLHMKRIRRRVY